MLNKLKIELYKHGMHLGCNVRYNTNLNYFILGIRFGHCVININKTLLLLKKLLLYSSPFFCMIKNKGDDFM